MIRGYKKLKVKKQEGPRGPEPRGQEEQGAGAKGKWPLGLGSHQVEFRPSPLSSQ